MSIDWSKAPEGATHAAFLPDTQQHLFFKFADDWWDVKNQEWSYVGGKPNFDLIERPKSTENPADQPKQLTQAVFHGAPDWVRFATVTSTGAVVHWEDEPFDAQGAWNVESFDSRYYVLAKQAYDYSNWQQSKIKRLFPIKNDFDVKELVEAFAANPPNFDDLMRSVAAAWDWHGQAIGGGGCNSMEDFE